MKKLLFDKKSQIGRGIKTVLLLVFAVIINVSCLGEVSAVNYASTPAAGVIGQPNLTSNTINSGDLSGSLYFPMSVFSNDQYTFIADFNNNRVLVYNGIPGVNGADTIADSVVGQPNMTSSISNNGGVSASSLSHPDTIYFDGQHLFVVDNGNNRVLIYNGVPGINGVDAVADIVIGQPDMISNTANNGGISASSLFYPTSVYSDGQYTLIADYRNNRVLIYDGVPGVNGADTVADYVVGQPNMTSNTQNNGGISASSLYNPYAVFTDGQHTFVTDGSNHRILIYTGIPGVNGADMVADSVIGQPNMTTNSINTGGLSASSLRYPYSVYFDGQYTMVTDYGNSRVLIYNGIPGYDGADSMADVVLGQPNMTSNTTNYGGLSASSLFYPFNTYSNGQHTFVADYANNRVLIYNGIPGVDGADVIADYVVGQSNMTSNVINSSGLSANSLHAPRGIFTDGSRLYVADTKNNRILVYNGFLNTSGWNISADYIIGQPDIASGMPNNGGLSASTLNAPRTVYSDGSRVYVVDTGNNRVLIYNGLPGEAGWDNIADTVIGQPDMASNTANNGGLSASSLNNPYSIFVYGNYLYVVDLGNQRVLLYNGIPGVNGSDAIADDVLGQPNMTTGTANYGGRSASSFYNPASFYGDGLHSFIADADNHRVLVFNGLPGIDGADKVADAVIGQPDMTSGTSNNGGISATTLNNPNAAFSDGQRVFVSDAYNNRVLIYNGIPGINGADSVADAVIGQPSMSIATANNGGIGASTLNYPAGVFAYNNTVLIGDSTNNRILFYNTGPQGVNVTLPSYTNVTENTIALTSIDAKEMMISTDQTFTGAQWETFATTKAVTLTTTEGSTTFYIKLRDYANYESEVFTKTITLDTTIPTGTVKINSDAAFTNTRNVQLSFTTNDTYSPISQVMIANENTFIGATWDVFTSTKDWVVTTGDGQKNVYVKFKDAAGNESVMVSDAITLDTVKPTINITAIGLIDSIPDKENLFYYFTSQTPHIKGKAEANSIVHFIYHGHDYTTTADNAGNYAIDIPELPRERVELSYYAIDQAGNRSGLRKLTLVIGIENFPVTTVHTTTEETSTPTGSPTPTPSHSGNETPIELYEVIVLDQSGKTLPHTKVYVNDQEYKTDANGKIYLEKKLSEEMTVFLEVNMQRVKGTVSGNKITAQDSTRESINSTANSSWWWLIIVVVTAVSVLLWRYRTRVNKLVK